VSSLVIALLSPRGGQWCTTVALSIAWELAARHATYFIDADMSGNSNAADLLHLRRDPEHHLGNLRLREALSAGELARQAVRHPKRPNLLVVPGLDPRHGSISGPSLADVLPGLAPAVSELDADAVVVDLGACLVYPRQESPYLVGQRLNSTSWDVLVTVHDAASVVANAAAVLKETRLARGRVILGATRGGSKQVIDWASSILSEETQLQVVGTVDWAPKRAFYSADVGDPMPAQQLVSKLKLEERIRADRGHPPAERKPRRLRWPFRSRRSERSVGSSAQGADV
jgi:hypothetical protein